MRSAPSSVPTRAVAAMASAVSATNAVDARASPAAPVGWYLQFTPNPSYSGQVRVGFRLTSALGGSNIGTVFYTLGYDAGAVAVDTDAFRPT